VRVIPVIDLKGGIAVHAVRGDRERYEPLRSVLVDSPDPRAVARALRLRCGLDELYVADLDAIAGGHAPHPAVGRLARETGVILDAGADGVDAVRRLLELAVDGVVVGTETLADPDALGRMRACLADVRIVLSLDLRGGRVVSRSPVLRGLSPADALERLARGAVQEVIVLDLARVGSRAGPDVALIAQLHRRFPGLRLLAGGGVRNADDLRALRASGAAGALVATALHTGALGRHDLVALRAGA
jgi:phosphoribosylformimino-5-aminoimidazole carboxamide ribotide isomerase